VYVCNLQPQEPETANYTTATYVDALRSHGVDPHVVIDDPGLAMNEGRAHDPKLLAPVLAGLLGPPQPSR
jgi:hypothetical protein